VRGQRRQLQERAARVEQGVDPLAGQQLAPLDVPPAGALTPAEGHALQLGGEVRGQFGMRGSIACGVGRRGSGQHRCVHGQMLTLVHSLGPPHTPDWLTIVHIGASMTSVTTMRDAALHADADRPSRREQILQAAAQLFAERGSRAVGVDDIGAAVGVTGPAIYRHFASKDAMLAEMLVRISEYLLAGGSERVADAGADPAAQLRALIAFHVDFALDNPALITVQDRDLGSLTEADAAQVRRLQRRYVEVWVTVLARLHPAADAATCRARAHAIFGLINSTPHSAGRLDRAAMAALLADMAWAAAR
jgi:AcrR family transcriptional regulator